MTQLLPYSFLLESRFHVHRHLKTLIFLTLLALATSQTVFAGTKAPTAQENFLEQQIILNLLRRPAAPQQDPPPPPASPPPPPPSETPPV